VKIEGEMTLALLPATILINISQYLPCKAVILFGQTCKQLYSIEENAILWKGFCMRDFLSAIPMEKRKLPTVCCTWKTYYRHFEKFLLLPFPGKSAVFKPDLSADWRVNYSGQFSSMRHLSFKSEMKDSLFTSFRLSGWENGNVAIHLRVSKQASKIVETYFRQAALPFSRELSSDKNQPERVFSFSSAEDRAKIFKILKTFNQIENSSVLTERLAVSTKWSLITPLRLEEIEQIEAYKNSWQVGLCDKIGKFLIGHLFPG
jgi:hypothetical protein